MRAFVTFLLEWMPPGFLLTLFLITLLIIIAVTGAIA